MRELKGEKLEAELKRIEALKQYEKEYEHLPRSRGVMLNDVMIDELKRVLGDDSVVLKWNRGEYLKEKIR